MDIRVEENPAAVVAEMLVEAGGRGTQLVLTGGSTPKLAYETAARAGADWSRTTVWFSDERCVGPEDGLSNFRMANDALVGRINKRPAAGGDADGGRGRARRRGGGLRGADP